MDLLKKRKEYHEAASKTLDYNELIRDYQFMIDENPNSPWIKKYQQKIEEIKLATNEIEKKLDNMKSDLTILVCVYKSSIGTIYIYYDADIERTRSSMDTLENVDIDLHDFFANYNRSLIYAKHHPSKIMGFIIDDMLSKKEYQSWDEVKKDLLKLEEKYRRPATNERSSDYYRRVITK